eukprot:TRINITY_DN3065_c0_g3_i1.p1 TRINITY_DN3065_c0_g3~~TRINITY_DN3065_c0_g3_i1.p1  ORF type:complete len:298 (+),score=72.30 TRINITY_DN3065_c0_g3_i1:1053-1946(+)
MPRHAKNNTNASYFTYAEKQMAKYGTEEARVGKDSLRNFDACGLCLQEAKDPLSTLEGVLYCKECIYENILKQKQDIKRKIALWELQEVRKKEGEKQKELDEIRAKAENFEKRESSVLLQEVDAFKRKSESSSSGAGESSKKAKIQTAGEVPNKLPYWVPSETPANAASDVQRPSEDILCPTTGKTIKLKQLFPVKFTLIKATDKESRPSGSKDSKFMCPICFQTLSNVSRSSVISTTGTVVCNPCTEKFVKKDLKDPVTGLTVKEKEIIKLQSGGTGFAAHDSTLVVKKSGITVQS